VAFFYDFSYQYFIDFTKIIIYFKNLNIGNKKEPIFFTNDIQLDPQNPATLYCDYQNFSKSIDAGLTWQQSTV